MSGVAVSLRKYIQGPYAPPAAAEIYNTRLQAVQQFELGANQQSKRITLDPGAYLVRAHLPSGEVIDASAVVGTEGFEPVELIASDSPHEWLSWQHFLGDVGAQGGVPLPIPSDVRASTWLRVWSFNNGQWRAEKANETSLYIRDQDENCLSVQGYFDPKRLFFLQLGGELVPQRMIGLPPAPGPIQILIRTTRNNIGLNGGIVARIASFDPAIEVLLRYITTGAGNAAKLMGEEMAPDAFSNLSSDNIAELDKAESWAKEKLLNLNGAAVGFYYLLQRAAYERLHTWPNNFANWFPWLPDAQVIHAVQLLNDPGQQNLPQAMDRLVAAANAGIPVYTAGLRYLYENLCACALDKNRPSTPKGVSEAYERIRDIAAAVDWREARTTFYGPDPSTPDCTRVTGIPDDHDTLFFLEKS